MKRRLRPEETRLWAIVAATVRPAPGRSLPVLPPAPEPVSPSPPSALAVGPPAPKPSGLRRVETPIRYEPDPIEPGRRRRIGRGRDPIEARLDLHGLDQDRARARLSVFLLDAQERGARSVLVITGKGVGGHGVLRRRAPEWLADPRLREVVAGIAPADTRHGGEGAFYVALKRRPR